MEAASQADGGAVEAEAVGAHLAAAHGEVAVDVPAASAGKAGGAELFLGEQNAGSQVHQHVNLAAVEGELAGHARVEVHAAGGVASLDEFGGLGGDGDLLGEFAHLELERPFQLFGHHEGEVFAAHAAEAGGFDIDVIAGRLEVGQSIEAFGVRFGGRHLIGTALCGADLCPRNDRAGAIGDLAGDGGAEVLRLHSPDDEKQISPQTTAQGCPVRGIEYTRYSV